MVDSSPGAEVEESFGGDELGFGERGDCLVQGGMGFCQKNKITF